MESQKHEAYLNFYFAFRRAVLSSIKENMALTLTGGYDTRIIAGILRERLIKMPCVCFGDRIENIISARIARACSLKCYVAPYPNFWFASRGYEELKAKGFRFLLSGLYFDEINASFSGNFVRDKREFRTLQIRAVWIQDVNLIELGLRFHGPKWITPIMDRSVINALEKIPFRYRLGKQIQRWILRELFPDLWRIPYVNSLIPSFLPYSLHLIMGQILKHDFRGGIRTGFKLLRGLNEA